jgi:hypothetical protein
VTASADIGTLAVFESIKGRKASCQKIAAAKSQELKPKP